MTGVEAGTATPPAVVGAAVAYGASTASRSSTDNGCVIDTDRGPGDAGANGDDNDADPRSALAAEAT